MTSARWHRRSLKRTLLIVLSSSMLAVLCAELALTWRTAVEAADAAFDRSLLGAIKAMDANLSTASGGLGVELPYRMLEFFQLTASGEVYYRVATEDGLVEIGDAGLPPPLRPLVTGQPQFQNTVYFGTPVRMGSYARLLDRPLAGQPAAQRVVIQVAEALNSREQFSSSLVWQALGRDLALVLVTLALLALAIGWALRPLDRLRREVAARTPDDLTPLDAPDIPADVRPLVAAINAHIDRNRRLAQAQREFVDDASHQLRTPLTTLGTQVAFALRETDPAQLRESLLALKQQVDDTIRQTNQMLALARTDSAELNLTPVDLVALASAACRRRWPQARTRGIDLGLDTALDQLELPAQAGLLDEALANLLHNALRYTPAGGQVTVSVRADANQAWLTVADNGPGIPEAERHRAGERFFRASNASQPGSGLGLAIARTIAERLGGQLRLGQPAQGSGLLVSLVLPLVDTRPERAAQPDPG